MKKLAGLLAFAVALAGAILITRYYTAKPTPPTPPSAPVQPLQPAAPSAPTAGTNVPVTFKPRLVTLDFALKRAGVSLTLERDPASPPPERLWVWAYFFTQESPGRYCSGDPVEVKSPFDTDGRARATVTISLPIADCPAPRTPSTTYYARVNVSTESSFAARLTEPRISYDITQASPVVLKGTGK